MSEIKVIIGLGNTGSSFGNTRHNVGHMFLDACTDDYGLSWQDHDSGVLSARLVLSSQKVFLIKTKTYMNVSGLPLRRFCEYYDVKPTEVLVVYDDMDYACGSLRLKKGGGHGGHNGVCDIIRHGFGDCWRLRIGIGRPTGMTEASHYVLGVPSLKERSLIDQSIQKALDGLVSIVQGKFSDLMNEWHQKEA